LRRRWSFGVSVNIIAKYLNHKGYHNEYSKLKPRIYFYIILDDIQHWRVIYLNYVNHAPKSVAVDPRVIVI